MAKSSASTDPKDIFVARDGLSIHALDWGGTGPPLLLLPPNGFCAGFFDPLAQRLRDDFRIIAVDLRGQGLTDTPQDFSSGLTFSEMAADVIAVLDELEIKQCDALGESLGGGVAAIVDDMRPGVLLRIMFCEAIAFDLGSLPTQPSNTPGDGGNFMAQIARKRRSVWPDRETVFASYSSRPPLDQLDPEAMRAYVRWGFVDRVDGQVELACAPEVEAQVFEISSGASGAPSAWEHLSELSARSAVFYGNESNLPKEWFISQAQRIGIEAHEVLGGHFFLQEDTERAVTLVRDFLATS